MTAVLSNAVSNVPAVLVLKPFIPNQAELGRPAGFLLDRIAIRPVHEIVPGDEAHP